MITTLEKYLDIVDPIITTFYTLITKTMTNLIGWTMSITLQISSLMYHWFSLMMMILLLCFMVFTIGCYSWKTLSLLSKKHGALNYCKEAKYDAIEFGVFKSTPNKLIIHSGLVVLTDSRVWLKVWWTCDGVQNIVWGHGIEKCVSSMLVPATLWVIVVHG